LRAPRVLRFRRTALATTHSQRHRRWLGSEGPILVTTEPRSRERGLASCCVRRRDGFSAGDRRVLHVLLVNPAGIERGFPGGKIRGSARTGGPEATSCTEKRGRRIKEQRRPERWPSGTLSTTFRGFTLVRASRVVGPQGNWTKGKKRHQKGILDPKRLCGSRTPALLLRVRGAAKVVAVI